MGLALLDDYMKLEKLWTGEKGRTKVLRRKIPKKRFELDAIGKEHTKATFKWSTLGGLVLSAGWMLVTGDVNAGELVRGLMVGCTAGGLNGAVKYLQSHDA
jgi:hypothetical protein